MNKKCLFIFFVFGNSGHSVVVKMGFMISSLYSLCFFFRFLHFKMEFSLFTMSTSASLSLVYTIG